MTWAPRHGHVSQLYRHAGDAPGAVEGANDCFEACLARFLFETAPQGQFPTLSDADLIGRLRLELTGAPDQAGQGFTTLEQASAGLSALGVRWRWTALFPDALAAPYAIWWVDAARLRLLNPVVLESGELLWTAYPASFLGADAGYDHFILRLPNGDFNDPLAYYCGDCAYSRTSLVGAFGGAFVLLPAPVPSTSPIPQRDAPVSRYRVAAPAGLNLRAAPEMDATVLGVLPHDTLLDDVYEAECLWSFVRCASGTGWVRREFVEAA